MQCNGIGYALVTKDGKVFYAKMLLKELLTRIALCNLIYVQEYKGLCVSISLLAKLYKMC